MHRRRLLFAILLLLAALFLQGCDQPTKVDKDPAKMSPTEKQQRKDKAGID